MNGQVGSFTRNEERAGVAGHGPVIHSGKLKANDGTYPTGMLLTRKAGELIALAVVAAEVIGTGNGSTKNFTAILTSSPLEPGTVSITDGVETFSDDGSGRLTGSAAGTGTVNYKTGKVTVGFNTNVVNTTNVTADYVTAVDGVLDEETDTAKSDSGLYVVHGTVDSTVLKIGKTNPVEPSAAVLMLLQAKGIYPK